MRHGTGESNIVQRALYVLIIICVVLLFFSRLAIWKPVQLQGLTHLLGGYDQARHILLMV